MEETGGFHFPTLTNILNELQAEFEGYKFTVYRCAAKFVKLQKIVFTNNIPYKLVLAVMDRHGMHDDVNLMVPPFQLTSLIHDIFFACEKLGHFTKVSTYSLESATAILSNLFWNIFDPHRRHSISLLEIKMTFLLLCKLYASDQMVMEFYSLLKNYKTKCVSKLNFEYMLSILAKIFAYLGEGAAYGAQNIALILDQCYSRCHNLSGLTDYQFLCLWTTTQTRFLIYANLIALIKRIEDTERLIHLNTCASCCLDKITGIRFKCQTCKDLSLCLKCFATGYTNNKHGIGHRMYEVFTEDIPPKKFSYYLSKLCSGVFCAAKKSSEESKGFANETITQNDTELVTIATNRSSNASTISVKTSHAKPISIEKPVIVAKDKANIQIKQSPKSDVDASIACLTTTASTAVNVSEKLQNIIDKLLHQNEKLEDQLKCIDTSTADEISVFLRKHQQFLNDIIMEMRNFSQNSSASIEAFPPSSTPNRWGHLTTSPNIDNVSAVVNVKSICGTNLPISYTTKDNLTHSINGADLNRTYLDANKSDYSINDLSSWFNQRRFSSLPPTSLNSNQQPLSVLAEVPSQHELTYYGVNPRETEMANFKLLLNKVKEIVDDSHSDNTDLSEATQNLENVLDSIINTAECRRKSLN
ncbi:dystrophin-1-like isoform X1 [Musca domestica]|uniref:Dystrophin-1-like isoform X1 n=1 Tax=Musca domestica TaxID=7370 RepID=A0ABM3VD05_MUSDO|nr:dystrophin-1-like isoform X1 [Musca domestica]